jgi:hypothetical protein
MIGQCKTRVSRKYIVTGLKRHKGHIFITLWTHVGTFWNTVSGSCNAWRRRSSPLRCVRVPVEHLFKPLRLSVWTNVTREPLNVFDKIWYWEVSLKFVHEFQFLLKSDKNNRYFTHRILCLCTSKWFQIKIVRKTKNILCSIQYFSPQVLRFWRQLNQNGANAPVLLRYAYISYLVCCILLDFNRYRI